jgi:hypothetical protein
VCYYTPAIADKFGPLSVYGRRGHGAGKNPGRLPAEPTPAAAGTWEKLAVMESRAARGETLFHPRDGHERRPDPDAARPVVTGSYPAGDHVPPSEDSVPWEVPVVRTLTHTPGLTSPESSPADARASILSLFHTTFGDPGG